jgi:indolepyruvate decarboxylase
MAPPDRLPVGAYLIDALAAHGVRHVFGVPGDFILGLYAIGEERGMRMVNCTREEAATYAADGYAREKGLGAVAVTFGVGILATMAALGGANAEGLPVVVIGGAPGMAERDGRRIHHFPADDVDAPRRMMQEITAHSVLLDDPAEAYDQIDWLLHTCKGAMLPGYIELPRDMIDAVPAGPPRSLPRPAPARVPTERAQAAADDVITALNDATRPIVWLGAGARRLDFGARALAFAEATGIPIVESVMGKGTVDETHPLVLGVYVGAGSPPELRTRVESSDMVFEVGVDVNDMTTGGFTAHIPVGNRINVFGSDTTVGHRVYPGVDLPALARVLETRIGEMRRHDIPGPLPYSWAPEVTHAGRITTDVVADRLQRFVRPSDIVVSDVGVAAHLSMDAQLTRHGQFHVARMYVGMGFAVPAAYGAALARGTGRPIVLVGDGSFQMTGFDLSTAIREGIAPIVLVLDNHGYGAERSIADGDFNDVAQWDYAAVAAVVGAVGTAVATPGQLDAALAAARADPGSAHIISVDLDKHDVPRGLKALGKALNGLMHATP